MSKVHEFKDEGQHGSYSQLWFNCPGCKCSHAFTIGSGDGPRWTWNGSLDRPTFTPSLLCNKEFPESRCHSFVIDGKIQFLGDCFHELAGQTVDIPEWDGF